jgi:DNA-binding transcriptional ArsR family regulator
MDPTFRVIDDPETLRLIADPLRLRLLELIRQQPRTVSELAELVGVQRTRLYYHIKLLESHTLIAVDETRVVSGLTEKRYRVTANRITVEKRLLGEPGSASGSVDNAPLDVFLSVILDEVATEIRRSVQSGLIDLDRTHEDVPHPRGLVLGRKWFHFTPERLAAYRDAVATLDAQFEEDRTSSPHPLEETSLYEVLTAFYPIVPANREGDSA